MLTPFNFSPTSTYLLIHLTTNFSLRYLTIIYLFSTILLHFLSNTYFLYTLILIFLILLTLSFLSILQLFITFFTFPTPSCFILPILIFLILSTHLSSSYFSNTYLLHSHLLLRLLTLSLFQFYPPSLFYSHIYLNTLINSIFPYPYFHSFFLFFATSSLKFPLSRLSFYPIFTFQ